MNDSAGHLVDLFQASVLSRLASGPLPEATVLAWAEAHGGRSSLEGLVARGSVVRGDDGQLSLDPARRDMALDRLLAAVLLKSVP